MATSKEYRDFVLEQLSGLPDITCRMMMGEYILYYRGRIIGDLCDNRLLVKPVESALRLMPGASMEPPYAGAKKMLLVENIDDRAFLEKLIMEMYPELPEPKKRATRR